MSRGVTSQSDPDTTQEDDMRVLIISFSSFPSAPSGPATIAGAALQAGHTVEVFDCFLAPDLSGLEAQITRFKPHVVGISIKFVTGDVVDQGAPFGTRHFDHRGRVKELVRRVQRASSAPIVLGGPGFNYFGPAWLDYLGLDYGIRGEAERAFPLYLQRLAEGGDVYTVPGCITRQNGRFVKVARDLAPDLDDTAFPAYELFDLQAYAARGVSPAILTKRGCALRCTFCPYSSLEGTRYRLKSPRRVVDEMAHVQRTQDPATFTFCDNSFNVPKSHAEAICQEIIHRKLDLEWSTGALKPLGLTDDLC
jgi:hypothetical protein